MAHQYVKWDAKAQVYVDSFVYEIATGKRIDCWPVDGKEMVATGKYSFEKPEPPVEPAVEEEDAAAAEPKSALAPEPEAATAPAPARKRRGRKPKA